MPYHTWSWRSSQTSQKCRVHFKTSISRPWSHVADRLTEANAQAPTVAAVYLLWATFHKGHLTEPVPSGGLWLRRAGGHLPDPTAGGVGGGGKGGGRQGGGGGGSWGGRASREKGTAPLAIRAVPGALYKLGGAISIRKQGQWTVKEDSRTSVKLKGRTDCWLHRSYNPTAEPCRHVKQKNVFLFPNLGWRKGNTGYTSVHRTVVLEE